MVQDRNLRVWGKLRALELDWVPQCSSVVWSKLLLDSMAARCWCWDQGSLGGWSVLRARREDDLGSRKDGEGLLEAPDVEATGGIAVKSNQVS